MMQRGKVFLLPLLITLIPTLCFGNFYTYMGKDLGLFDLIESKEEGALLEKYAALYEKNLPLLEHPPLEWKIPQVVHFIWLGPKGFPAESVENVRSWIAHHPEWTVKFWTDRKRPLPCNGMELCFVQDFSFTALQQEFEEAQNWGQKSDILRYEILFQEGGVYVDHDGNCLSSFEPFHRAYHLYTCLELPHSPHAGKTITSGIGVVGSIPGHPVLKKAIQLVKDRWSQHPHVFAEKAAHVSLQETLFKTYLPFSLALETEVGKEGYIDIVLPTAYFYAKPPLPELYSKHFYGASWIESAPSHNTSIDAQLDIFRKELSRLSFLSFILATLLILALVVLFQRKRSALLVVPFFCIAAASQASETPEDRENLTLFMQRLKTYQKPVGKKIPQRVHFLYLDAQKPSSEMLHNLSSWIDLHPGWSYTFWSIDKHSLPHPELTMRLLKSLPLTYLAPCYPKAKHLAECAEIARYEILFQEGGVVVDLGARCLQSFEPLHSSYDMYTALAPPHLPILSSSIVVSPRIIGATPGHPIIETCMKTLVKEWDMIEGFYPGTSTECVQKRLAFLSQRVFDAAVKAQKGVALPFHYFFATKEQKPLFAEVKENPHLLAKTRKELKTSNKWSHLQSTYTYLFSLHIALLVLALLIIIKATYDRRRTAQG